VRLLTLFKRAIAVLLVLKAASTALEHFEHSDCKLLLSQWNMLKRMGH
jgi:hypothetical protein